MLKLTGYAKSYSAAKADVERVGQEFFGVIPFTTESIICEGEMEYGDNDGFAPQVTNETPSLYRYEATLVSRKVKKPNE